MSFWVLYVKIITAGMDSNLLTSYYFLATLAENNTDIYDSVYVPLCKRCLSRISRVKKHGSQFDVQKQFLDDYGLNVPAEIVRQLLVRINNRLSVRERNSFGFTILDKGRFFQFDQFSCGSIEESYNQIRRGANALEEAFQDYVRAQGQVPIVPFQDFIDANKQKLSSYFTGNGEQVIVDEAFLLHAKFLRHIESSHHELYKAAEKSYLGSIIAAYFESGVNVEAKQDSGVVYYLDTRVLFEILDLQDPESTKPAQDLLNLIKKTGGKPRVLSITINEMTDILAKELQAYNINNPKTTIGDACKRRGLKKIALVSLHGNLTKELQASYGISMDLVSESFINKNAKSVDIPALMSIGYRSSNARHDVLAYLNVREKRSTQTLVQKIDYWFVTVNERLYSFNKRRKGSSFPEIILSSELTSLLFLRNPKDYASEVSSKGLASLIAQTLTDEYADRDLINQFDELVHDKVDVSNEDYELLIRYLATESTSRLYSLIEDVTTKDTDTINQKIQEIVNKTRNGIEADQQTLRELERKKEAAEEKSRNQEEINCELEKRLADSELQMAAVSRSLKQQEAENKKRDAEIKKFEAKNRRWWFFLMGVIVVVVSFLLSSINGVSDCWKHILTWVKSAGGLWAFGNLILNLFVNLKK